MREIEVECPKKTTCRKPRELMLILKDHECPWMQKSKMRDGPRLLYSTVH